jgi:hypothetical protein
LLSFEIINSIFTQIVEQYDLIVMGVNIWWNSLALKRANIEIFYHHTTFTGFLAPMSNKTLANDSDSKTD